MSTLDAQSDLLVGPGGIAESPADRSLRLAKHLNWSLLVLSTIVVAIAALLEVRGGTSVAVPLLGYTLPELCYWRRMFGMDCPGCGLTRCFVSLAHFDLPSAWRYNPAGILLFGVVASQIPWRTWHIARGVRPAPPQSIPILPFGMAAVAVLLIVQWLVRIVVA